MRFLHDFEAGFTLLTYNLKVHFTFSAISILAPPCHSSTSPMQGCIHSSSPCMIRAAQTYLGVIF